MAPGFAAVLAAVQQNYQAVYGSDADLSADTQDGQLASILATAINDVNDLCIDVYNAFSPSFAQGNGLSSVVKINGMTRAVASFSTATVTCVGQSGTSVGGLTLTDPSGNPWVIASPTTIPGGGSIVASITCGALGAVALGTGVAMTITTPTPGFQSATTASIAVTGNPVETDAGLRQRQAASTALPAKTPATGSLAAIFALPGVTRATYDENSTGSADSNSVPGHSISFVVEGGTNAAIASAIANYKTEGTGTYGSTAVTVTDQYGISKTINFYILSYTQIYVALTLTHLAGWNSATAALIQNVLVAAINGMAISQVNNVNVTVGPTVRYSKLYDAVNLSGDVAQAVSGLTQAQLDAISATYDVNTFYTGTAPAPTGVVNIVLSFGYAAQTNTSQVTVS